MKLSTSSRISLGFSLLSIIILGLFSLVVYQLFNQGRQRSEKNIVRTDPRIQQLLQEREQQ
jgi:CHASE3 domain sensor protein